MVLLQTVAYNAVPSGSDRSIIRTFLFKSLGTIFAIIYFYKAYDETLANLLQDSYFLWAIVSLKTFRRCIIYGFKRRITGIFKK